MELWRYYRIIRRWRWVIVAGMLAGVVAGAVFNRPSMGDYTATATFVVPAGDQGLPGAQTGETGSTGFISRSDQALGLIWSQGVAERVIKDLNLNMSVYELHLRLSAVKELTTPLIHVTLSGRTPAEALRLTNGFADTVEALDKERLRREFTVARELVERQLQDAQTNLKAQESALTDFRKQNEADLAVVLNQQVTQLQTQIGQSEIAIREAEARLDATNAQLRQQSPTRSQPQISANPVTSQLQTDLVRLEVQLANEQSVHTDSHPHVIALQQQIKSLKERLAGELGKVITSETLVRNPVYDSLLTTKVNLESTRIAEEAKHSALQQVLANVRSSLPSLAQKQAQRSELERGISTLGQVVQTLEQQLSNARLREQAAQAMTSLTVVNHAATASPNPCRDPRLVLMAALVLGILAGLGLAFLLEYLDNTVRTPVRAEAMLGLPALATVPRHNPPFDEAYRMLRVNLVARGPADDTEILAFTGTKPGAGVSTVIANAARAFAQAGRRTVIVDAAVDRPIQHSRFGIANEIGLINVLRGEAALAEALVPTGVANLSVLPSGSGWPTDEEPDGALSSPAMRELLGSIRRQADIVLVDTSPATLFAATLDVTPMTSGTILVLDANSVPRGLELQAKTHLERVGATVIGFVLTKVRPDLVDSYYYHERQRRMQRAPRLAPTAAGLVLLVAAGGLAGAVLAAAAGHLHLSPAAVQALTHWPAFGGPAGFGAR